jgi:hypothetical protein
MLVADINKKKSSPSKCFLIMGTGDRIPLAKAIESASAEVRKMTKEEVRSLEGESEKDVDSSEEPGRSGEGAAIDQPPLCTVDFDSLR